MTRISEEQKPRILFVEDDDLFMDTISLMLEDQDYKVIACKNQTQALERIIREPDFALALIDMRIPTEKLEEDSEGGLEVIRAVKKYQPNTECIVMTGYGSIDNVVKAMQLGASNYLVKGDSPNDLILETVRQALENWQLRQDNSSLQEEVLSLRKQLDEKFGVDNIIGESKQMLDLLGQVRQVAPTKANVLIAGETGSGKELIARAIHYSSLRKGKMFLAINCAAIPQDLFESELFGYEQGAFTGANTRKIGKFELVNGGTLFLDEIDKMAYEMQVKLLRVIEDREFMRVGGLEPIRVDVRIIAATNKNLEEALKKNEFPEDLFYRLNQFPLRVPPLRGRREDIPLLVHSFIEELSKEINKPVPVTQITPEAMNYLKNADWPGNVRELRNVIERAIILTTTDTIELDDISTGIFLSDYTGRWPDAPQNALFESFKCLVELGNEWNMIEHYLVAAAMAEEDSDADAASLIGMKNPNTLRSKRDPNKGSPLKRDMIEECKKFLKKQGKSEKEIDEEIEKLDKQLGDLKTRKEREKLVEKFPLYNGNL